MERAMEPWLETTFLNRFGSFWSSFWSYFEALRALRGCRKPYKT